jgi:hypothetical protein
VVGGAFVEVDDGLDVTADVDDAGGIDVVDVVAVTSTVVESADPSELSLQAPSAAITPAARTAFPHALFIATPPLRDTSRMEAAKAARRPPDRLIA